jgi:simple sugar transport system ATP-binding protein
VGATADVHCRLLDARRQGAAVVLISEDLDELLRCQTVSRFSPKGQLSPAEPVESLTLERLGLLMAGHTEEHAA